MGRETDPTETATTGGPPRGIVRTARTVRLGEEPSDFAYWQAQPYEARLAALEEIRQEYHRWRYGSEPGFQRLYRIVKR
jgi:hypothetical protein